MHMQVPLHVKVTPSGQGGYSYEYPLGRGFVRRARKIRCGVIRFWFKEGFSVSTVIVNLLAESTERTVRVLLSKSSMDVVVEGRLVGKNDPTEVGFVASLFYSYSG